MHALDEAPLPLAERLGPLGLGARFWRYSAASVASGLGDGVRFAALPLLAASLTRSPVLVAAVATAQSLPWLLVNPVSGVLVDRLDRRQVMLASAVFRVGITASLIAILVSGLMSIWWLCGLGLFLGCADTFGYNSSIGLLAALVRPAQLERANGVSQGLYAVGTNLVGPALGGLLFTVAEVLPFSLDMATFILVVALLAGLRGDYRALRDPERRAPRGIWAEMAEGLGWLWRHRTLRTLAALVGATNLGFGLMIGVLVLFVLEVLHLPRAVYGPLLAVFAAGGLLGTVASVRLGPRLRSTAMLRLVLLVQALGAGAVAIWPCLEVVIPAFFVIGLFSTIWAVVVVAYRQHVVPDALLGRVTSAFLLVGLGAEPVGTLLGGVVAARFGLRAPFALAAIVMLAGLLLGLPVLRGAALVVDVPTARA